MSAPKVDRRRIEWGDPPEGPPPASEYQKLELDRLSQQLKDASGANHSCSMLAQRPLEVDEELEYPKLELDRLSQQWSDERESWAYDMDGAQDKIKLLSEYES